LAAVCLLRACWPAVEEPAQGTDHAGAVAQAGAADVFRHEVLGGQFFCHLGAPMRDLNGNGKIDNGGELVQSAVDYPYTFTVTDSLGMTSVAEGIISVDVLVIRSGDVLKMQVPSIIFRSDNADRPHGLLQ